MVLVAAVIIHFFSANKKWEYVNCVSVCSECAGCHHLCLFNENICIHNYVWIYSLLF